MKYALIIVLLTLVLCCDNDSGAYSAEILVFTHGTHRIMTMKLTDEKVTVIRHSTNNEPDKVLADRILTAKEKGDLAKFFGSFPLHQVKEKYVNEQVEGEIHREFKVCVKGTCRSSYVYFMEAPALDKLVEKFSELVPEAGE